MSNERFEFGESTTPKQIENCNSCENYYTGACDGLRGYCSSYKAYRVRTLEELARINIGTIGLVGIVLSILIVIGWWM